MRVTDFRNNLQSASCASQYFDLFIILHLKKLAVEVQEYFLQDLRISNYVKQRITYCFFLFIILLVRHILSEHWFLFSWQNCRLDLPINFLLQVHFFQIWTILRNPDSLSQFFLKISIGKFIQSSTFGTIFPPNFGLIEITHQI